MSNAIRDLWPDDIRSEDVISPEEILDHQAKLLEHKTGGVLVGYVVRHEGKDRVVLGFEAEVARTGRRVRLFEVQRRLKYEYPAAVEPPDKGLPGFLKKKTYRGGLVPDALAMTEGKWVENEWVASSPTEFAEMVQEVLGGGVVKGILLSLLARAKREQPPNDTEGDES